MEFSESSQLFRSRLAVPFILIVILPTILSRSRFVTSHLHFLSLFLSFSLSFSLSFFLSFFLHSHSFFFILVLSLYFSISLFLSFCLSLFATLSRKLLNFATVTLKFTIENPGFPYVVYFPFSGRSVYSWHT